MKEKYTAVEKSTAELTQVGALVESYRDHIKAAYDIAKKMKGLGIERPWITFTEEVSLNASSGLRKPLFEEDRICDVPVRIRLEVRS